MEAGTLAGARIGAASEGVERPLCIGHSGAAVHGISSIETEADAMPAEWWIVAPWPLGLIPVELPPSAHNRSAIPHKRAIMLRVARQRRTRGIAWSTPITSQSRPSARSTGQNDCSTLHKRGPSLASRPLTSPSVQGPVHALYKELTDSIKGRGGTWPAGAGTGSPGSSQRVGRLVLRYVL